MSKTIHFIFATPDPLKFETTSGKGKEKKTTVKRRDWNGEKLYALLEEQLPGAFESRFPDYELQLEHGRKRDIRLEGWKPDDADDIKQAFDELVGEIMQDIEPEEFLLA